MVTGGFLSLNKLMIDIFTLTLNGGVSISPKGTKNDFETFKRFIVATVSEATMDFFLWYGNKKNL